jgi:hypothetical protein
MIIWKGYGFLVPVIAIVVGALISLLFGGLFNMNPSWTACIASFAAAAAVWFVGKKFNDPAKDRVMIDKQTGQEFIIKPDHTLFFIKMQYWAFVLAAFGVLTFITAIAAP